jgi:ABC-2 type transport system ATP-binding protein
MTTGLDPAARRIAWDLVAQVRERGATVLLVTHFMDEAERLCDRLAVLAAGRVIATGTPNDLVTAMHQHTRVRCSLPVGTDPGFLDRVSGVHDVAVVNGAAVVSGTGPLLARVAHALVESGIEPDDLEVDRPSLEEAYLELTSGGGLE